MILHHIFEYKKHDKMLTKITNYYGGNLWRVKQKTEKVKKK